MIEIKSSGSWPESCIYDVNSARSELANLGHPITKLTVVMIGSKKTEKHLNYPVKGYGTTYRKFLKNNGLAEIIIDEAYADDVISISFLEDTCIITGIEWCFENPCDFCDNPIHLHHEAVKLKDGRLVCDRCYTKVFDSVLHSSSQGERK